MIDQPSPRRRFFAIALILCCFAGVPMAADISIAGEQDGFLETGHYLVTSSITVKRGKTLSFAPGCIVRFKRFAGIIVEGALKCVGTAGLPILFTSENHRLSDPASADAPAPFDWNGVLVVDSLASLDLERVHVIYSTFGIDIKSTKSNVRLQDVMFDENGQFNLKAGSVQLDVKENEPFSIGLPSPVEGAPSAPPAPVLTEPKPEPVPPAPALDKVAVKKTPKKGAWKLPVRIGCGAVALIGAGAAIFYDSEVAKYQKKYEGVHSHGDQPLLDTYWDKGKQAEKQRNTGTILAIVGTGCFTITFLF
jgi:hypothetical protein